MSRYDPPAQPPGPPEPDPAHLPARRGVRWSSGTKPPTDGLTAAERKLRDSLNSDQWQRESCEHDKAPGATAALLCSVTSAGATTKAPTEPPAAPQRGTCFRRRSPAPYSSRTTSRLLTRTAPARTASSYRCDGMS